VDKVVWSHGKTLLRHSTLFDIERLSPRMREADRAEIWASNHSTPERSLHRGFMVSELMFSLENDGQIVAMMGLTPMDGTRDLAGVWLLGSDEIEEIAGSFVRATRFAIYEVALKRYPELFNFVDVRNRKSIRWLKRMGAQFDEPAPYGVDGLPFRRFTLRREVHKDV
jgi:hypothetical protein